jgi:hypothetical protein
VLSTPIISAHKHNNPVAAAVLSSNTELNVRDFAHVNKSSGL